jgi:general L-amino acid transport system permease protein
MAGASIREMDPEHSVAYVREVPVEPLPPPVTERGIYGWLRTNFFATPVDALLSILILLLAIWTVPPLLNFLVFDAVWTGKDREACLVGPDRPEVGACWAFVRDRFAYFIYGSYPISERWRVDIFFAMLAIGVVWLLRLNAPRRDLGALYFFIVVPIVSYVLLNGFESLGLRRVDTSLWGGMLVTIVVAWVGIVVSLPAGILLALGRRSRMPAVKLFSVIFIEFVRGVPLITVLFMASVMLPLFVPEQW